MTAMARRALTTDGSYAKLNVMPTVPPADKALLDAAVEVARSGGAVTTKWFRHNALEVEAKGDGTPVTQADKAAEHVIRDHIDAVSPEATIIGEEHGTDPGTSGLTWYVDPIDGTKAFMRGVPMYSTLIAVDDEHGAAVGVIYIPATEEIIYAGRGLGCFTQDGIARVSATETIDKAFVSSSCNSRWDDGVYERLRAGGATLVGWGDGYGFLMAASGRIDAMVDLGGGSIWDFAPMRVIMAEAGGRYSARDGSTSIRTRDGIASNGLIHDALLKAITGQ